MSALGALEAYQLVQRLRGEKPRPTRALVNELTDHIEALSRQRDMLQLDRECGREIAGEIANMLIEAVPPNKEPGCGCVHCAVSKGVARAVAVVHAARAYREAIGPAWINDQDRIARDALDAALRDDRAAPEETT